MNPRNGHVEPTVWYAPTGARGGAHFAPDGRGGGYAGYNGYHYPPHAYWGPDGTYGAHYQQVGYLANRHQLTHFFSGAPLVAGWETESSSSRLQKRLTVVAEETAAVEEEARIATKNRKTAIATATATAAAATIATARAETIIDARRTTTTTDKQRTGPRWLPVLETRRPRQSPQSTTMSHQLFKKHKKIKNANERKYSRLPKVWEENNWLSDSVLISPFLFHLPYIFLSRLIKLTPFMFVFEESKKSPFLTRPKKALFQIKQSPNFPCPHIFPNPLLI